MAEPVAGDEALRELRDRIRSTQEAAERIVREANAEAAGGGRVPPRGWEAPADAAGPAATELQALVSLLESLRGMLPPELREQVSDLMRQLLLVLRALIDWLVDRMEDGPRGAAPTVEDIPIA
jgi:hypothetical protein